MTKKDFSRSKYLLYELVQGWGHRIMDPNKVFYHRKRLLKIIRHETSGIMELKYGRGGSNDFLTLIINDFSKIMKSFSVSCQPRVLNLFKKGYLKIE